MDGRLQSELNIEHRTDDKVKAMPDYVNRWYLNLKASRKTAATRRDYVNKIHHFLSYINSDVSTVSLKDINEQNVTEYFLSIQTKEINGEISYTSDSYQGTVWSCLDSFLGYLYNNKLISQNYIRNINKPKNRDLDRINAHRVMLTEKDFKKVIKAIDTEGNERLRIRDRAIVLLYMNTGMRKTALGNIILDDLDLDKKMLVIIDKGTKRHTYPLNDGMVQALQDWIDIRGESEDNHLFLSMRNRGISGNALENIVKKYTERGLGYGVSPHKLRSGYCSILYKKKRDIEFVRRCVGHANITTTQRYIVTNGEEKERAAEIMAGLF